ncbi:MAG: NAD(P)-binding domain-containing protein [Actinomycetia bacterium]|nr:NAD(P)-binding domain-containing protein [Actinomycetes bacterium]
MTEPPTLDVAVVGGGPSGLILARRLARTDASFEVYERQPDLGGIWNIDAPGSPIYESAHFISSKTLSGFPGFPMADDFPDYPSHRQVLSYIHAFADRFDLRRHIRFGTSVERAAPTADGAWELSFDDGGARRCRYLICANGVTWIPNLADWPGNFNGEVRHAVTYRSPREFEGRRVLVVGGGNSGADIACDASSTADQAFWSVRRGYHLIPKHVFGKPADVFADEGPKLPNWLEVRVFTVILRLLVGDLRRYGLPKPDHKLFESHPLLNTQILHYLSHGDCIAKPDVDRLDGDEVIFEDGSREQIDLVIAATGYQHSCPFLDSGVLPTKGGRPDLYLGMFARNHPNLAVLGFIEFAAAAYPTFDRMAELICADATAAPGSSTAERFRDLKANHFPDLKGGHHYICSDRHSKYVELDAYLKILRKVRAKIGLTGDVAPR